MNSDIQKKGAGEICMNAKASQAIRARVQHGILEKLPTSLSNLRAGHFKQVNIILLPKQRRVQVQEVVNPRLGKTRT